MCHKCWLSANGSKKGSLDLGFPLQQRSGGLALPQLLLLN